MTGFVVFVRFYFKKMDLIKAIQDNDILLLKMLLKNLINKNNINFKSDLDGLTPLMIASYRSTTNYKLKFVKLLLESGADPNVQNYFGTTALMMISKIIKTSISNKTVKMLLDYGADVKIQDDLGMNALMYASKFAGSTGSVKTVKLLLDHIFNSWWKIIKDYFLIDSPIEYQNNDGMTALMLASKYSNNTSSNETVKLLLDGGAFVSNLDIFSSKNNYYTPLMYAVKYSNTSSSIETIKLLIDKGADVNRITDKGESVITVAVLSSNATSSIETLKLMIDLGANQTVLNISLLYAISYSGSLASIKTVEILLDAGADINYLVTNESMFHVPMIGINTDSNVLDFLLGRAFGKMNKNNNNKNNNKNNKNLDHKNNDGNTPLMLASMNDDYKSRKYVESLLNFGANPFIKNNKNEYPLDVCKSEISKKLISKYIWKAIYKNIKIKSKKYKTQNQKLSSNIWELILLREKYQQLSKDLNDDQNKYVLYYFAKHLNIQNININIDAEENINIDSDLPDKKQLCNIIYKQLSLCEKYKLDPEQLVFKRKMINIGKILNINTEQSTDNIKHDIENSFNYEKNIKNILKYIV